MRRLKAVFMMLCVAAFAAAQDEAAQLRQYEESMRQAKTLIDSIRLHIDGDLASVPGDAEQLADVFDQVEGFWILRDDEEAQQWALDIQEAADELSDAAGANDQDGAREALQGIQQRCASCHDARREQQPGGSYRIKQPKKE